MKKRLGRTVQCKACPWKVGVDVPKGVLNYCESKHRESLSGLS